MLSQQDDWQAFKQAPGSDRLAAGIRAIEAAVAALERESGLRFQAVILFGSFARGEVTYDDIDLLIVVEDSPGSTHQITRQLAQEVFGPLFLRTGELFSALVYTRERFEALEPTLPLFEEIEREGILVYGRDPFD
jgi:predicted nucleotidyltransferase